MQRKKESRFQVVQHPVRAPANLVHQPLYPHSRFLRPWMVKLRGRTWAAKRGLLRDESRTPGKFWVGKLLQKCVHLWSLMLTLGRFYCLLAFGPFLKYTSIYRSIWLCRKVRKRVEVKVVSVRLSHLPWSMPMKTLANVICHLVAMGSPSEPLSEVFLREKRRQDTPWAYWLFLQA